MNNPKNSNKLTFDMFGGGNKIQPRLSNKDRTINELSKA